MSDQYRVPREYDWRAGRSHPHMTVACPTCLGLTHKRGRHIPLDQARQIVWQRQRAAASQAAASS